MSITVNISKKIENLLKDEAGENTPIGKYAESIFNKHYGLKPEDVAYWYFRLNGFLTTTSFIVHPDEGGGQGTDADILGIRFPHHYEHEWKDDLYFKNQTKPMLAICEVGTSKCKINGPWSADPIHREKKNIHYVLEGSGLVRREEVDGVADELYLACFSERSDFTVQMFAMGGDKDSENEQKYPKLIQLQFADVLSFIEQRFKTGRTMKACNQQWNQAGKMLWKLAWQEDDFANEVQRLIGIRSPMYSSIHRQV